MGMKFGDDRSKTATCIAVKTDRQTDKQTNRQTNRQTNILANFFEILASNERAIGDCVLAKISIMMITQALMVLIMVR